MAEPSPMQIDVGLVRELAALLDHTRLTEIEVEDGGRRIRVARTPAPAAAAQMFAPAVPVQAQAPQGQPTQAASTQPAPQTDSASAADDLAGAVRSPIVGTVYLSPDPNSPAFAPEGAQVKEGDTIVIIEAMKVMNPIPAPRAGTVRRVLVRNEQPVEYDQPLIVIA